MSAFYLNIKKVISYFRDFKTFDNLRLLPVVFLRDIHRYGLFYYL